MQDFSLIIAQYNSSLPTLADGQVTGLQVDVNGRLLVQADVTVLVDFLGLNGASNSANILIVGTEDGTDTGTAHAVRLSSNGSVVIDDGGASITVDASNLDIRDLVFATDKVDVTGSLVDVQATDLDIRDLTHVSDSVKVGDGTDFLAVNADGSINITDNGGSLTVDAVDLDIRDLAFATDSVDVSNSTNVAVVDGGGSLTVDAVDFDIRDLDAAQDNVAISDGTDVLAINADGSINITDNGSSITVDAVDLDIRDLSHTQDSVKIGDGVDFLAVNADGSINVISSTDFEGTEAYNATDNLAAGADGLATITAAGTPWITTTSIAVGAGQVLHVYGFDWTADKNANARLISDDGTDIIVYKQSLNSSAMPDQFKYFGEFGRIEIAGSATMNVKIQIKVRSASSGNASGSSSVHARIV